MRGFPDAARRETCNGLRQRRSDASLSGPPGRRCAFGAGVTAPFAAAAGGGSSPCSQPIAHAPARTAQSSPSRSSSAAATIRTEGSRFARLARRSLASRLSPGCGSAWNKGPDSISMHSGLLRTAFLLWGAADDRVEAGAGVFARRTAGGARRVGGRRAPGRGAGLRIDGAMSVLRAAVAAGAQPMPSSAPRSSRAWPPCGDHRLGAPSPVLEHRLLAPDLCGAARPGGGGGPRTTHWTAGGHRPPSGHGARRSPGTGHRATAPAAGQQRHAPAYGAPAELGAVGRAPCVIGIDGWAWRKGHRYGTPICDLERREAMDLPPDREPGTVAAWLAARPSVEIIARDRGGGYAAGARQGRPEAIQVADRRHLMENASAAFLLAPRRCMRSVRRALGEGAADPATLAAAERLQREGWKRRVEAEAAVRALHASGVPIKKIVRRTGRSRKLLRDVLRGGRGEPFRPRASSLEPWLDRLNTEWGHGCRNGAELWRRLRAAGFAGSLRVVTERATRRRRDDATARPGRCPAPRALARLLTLARDRLTRAEAVIVATVEHAVPPLVVARGRRRVPRSDPRAGSVTDRALA